MSDKLSPIRPSFLHSSPTSSFRQLDSPVTRNPVSVRLYKVLGSHFDDAGSKEALRTLSTFYAPATTVDLAKQQIDVSDEDEDDDDAVPDKPAIAAPASFLDQPPPKETAARARKNLRRDVEARLAEGSRQFLAAFGEVDQQLNLVQEHISAMRMRCDEADQQLASTNEACKSLLERAGSLREQRQAVAEKQSIVSLFISRFTLADEETEAIVSRDIAVGPRFFEAMDKTQRIREECHVLMAGEDGPTKVGLDIMASTSASLEQGYAKIARYLSYEFRKMGRDALLEVEPTMAEALRRLSQRQELLSECLSVLSQTRQGALSSAFLDALTRGTPRPIELHAHDPLRYAGDMLAWVHQAIAAEREFLDALFGIHAPRRMVGAVRTFNSTEEEENVRSLMDAAVSRLCVPLQARVRQTVRAQESAITAYKVANLLRFYTLTMNRTLGEEALLSQTLQELTQLAYKVFFEAIEAQGRALERIALDPTDSAVTAPLAILDHAQVLKEIMTVYQSSTSDEDAQGGDHEADFRPILDIMMDPAIETCVNGAHNKAIQRPKWDKQVFVLNCMTYLQGVLEPYPFTKDKQTVLEGLIQSRVHELSEEHSRDVLKASGLQSIQSTCNSVPAGQPLSRVEGARPHELRLALRTFSNWLSTIDTVQSERLAQLSTQRLHAHIHEVALERVLVAYAAICAAVRKPENFYESPTTVLGSERPFGQIHLLKQIFGLPDQ